ncbi:PREDICTED: peptidyl-tRNA hydrolase 2, mitochondrial-like [Polistes dominula]|uniref:peptidyl-tRNA hydrolase n=1 Tax=Polistes dominula TaxID=743375 RepID=A0ABM1J5U9_POLDO|nr:PREDICTED: peptidyl-tRNA hydrolase 2, mitochondrial-like [Polistes dominula]
MSLIFKQVMPNLFRVLPAASYKMVIVVRTDISMGTGKIAAQCAHAAVECYRNTPINPMKQYMFRSWLYNGQPKVVLQVSSEYKLLELEQNAKKIGLVTAVIKDAGRTQLKPGTISVLGIGPDLSTEVNRVTSHLQLL